MKKLWDKFMLWWLYKDRLNCEIAVKDCWLDKEDIDYFEEELVKIQDRINYYEGMLNGK